MPHTHVSTFYPFRYCLQPAEERNSSMHQSYTPIMSSNITHALGCSSPHGQVHQTMNGLRTILNQALGTTAKDQGYRFLSLVTYLKMVSKLPQFSHESQMTLMASMSVHF